MPVVDANLPNEQNVHACFSPALPWYVPAAHEVHEVILDAEYLPAAHKKHVLLPVGAYLPALQPTQLSLVAPARAMNRPSEHRVQLAWPAAP